MLKKDINSVGSLLEDIKATSNIVCDVLDTYGEIFCDKYCKYPALYKHEEYGRLKREHCQDCPMNYI